MCQQRGSSASLAGAGSTVRAVARLPVDLLEGRIEALLTFGGPGELLPRGGGVRGRARGGLARGSRLGFCPVRALLRTHPAPGEPVWCETLTSLRP